MSANQPAKLLAHLMTMELDKPLTLSSGATIPAGTTIIFVPQTTAQAVSYGDQSLHEYLPSMESTLANYQGELVRLAARHTEYESVLAEVVYWARNNGYDGSGFSGNS